MKVPTEPAGRSHGAGVAGDLYGSNTEIVQVNLRLIGLYWTGLY